MLFDKKFDLVLSIGEDCACTSYLRRCKLQDYSYPFDWLTKASFSSRLDVILSNFSNFLNKEDLYFLEKPKNGLVDDKCDYWADKRYDFYFYHDFPAGIDFNNSYPAIKEKYDRRIKRLYKQINNSKNILFVWWSRNKHQDSELVKYYYNQLSQKFPSKSIYILIIEFGEKEEDLFLENGHILISKFDNISYRHNPCWNEVIGNETNNLKIFSQIKMKRPLKWHIKHIFYYILKIFIEIIPIKHVRGKLRHNLKTKFYKEAL